MRKYFSKSAKRDFAILMAEIDQFCQDNNISKSLSSDSYYFSVNGQNYRVSNHSVSQSNEKAYDAYGRQWRPLYHPNGEEIDTIYIRASKTRIMEIYNNLLAGKQLDSLGRVKN